MYYIIYIFILYFNTVSITEINWSATYCVGTQSVFDATMTENTELRNVHSIF